MSKEELLIIAGPCAVESKEQVVGIAMALKDLGIKYIRGGAFKPRTSPNSFQGLGEEGLKYLKEASDQSGLKIVSEVLSTEDIELVSNYVDVIQVGSRNMQNFELLKKLGKKADAKTILLKRGFSANKKELLGAITYLLEYGHSGDILFCERGIRTFTNGDYDRFTLDCSIIADLKKDQSFPYKVIVDPSHPAGRADIVTDLALSGIAANADGLIVEVKLDENIEPKCDAAQAITISEFANLLDKAKKIHEIV